MSATRTAGAFSNTTYMTALRNYLNANSPESIDARSNNSGQYRINERTFNDYRMYSNKEYLVSKRQFDRLPSTWIHLWLPFARSYPKPTWAVFLGYLLAVEHGLRTQSGGDWQLGKVNNPLYRGAEDAAEGSVEVERIGSVVKPEERLMIAMSHEYDNAGNAGNDFIPTTVRKSTDGTIANLDTREQLGSLLTASSDRTLASHEAANRIHVKGDGLLSKIADTSLTTFARADEYDKLLAIEADYEAAVAAEMANNVARTEPTDTDLYLVWAHQKIEVAAAKKSRYIVGATNQQGIYAVAPTRTQQVLLELVSSHADKAKRLITRAHPTNTAMKSAMEAGITAINGVELGNSQKARWYDIRSAHSNVVIGGSTISPHTPFVHNAAATEAQDYITLEALPYSSDNTITPAAVEYEILQEGFSVELQTVTGRPTAHKVIVRYLNDTAPVAGDAVRLVARADFGPTPMTVVVPAAAPPTE